jgi:hypothetical protein
MDALSNSLISVTAIDPVVSASAPVTVSGDQASTSSTAALEPSVRTFFSDFAQSLIAQQANDPTQSIDAAIARNPLSPTLSYFSGGQLYNSAGLLQQYATTQYLAQLGSDQSSDTSSNALTYAQGFSFFNSRRNQTIENIVSSYEQIALVGRVSRLDSTPQPSVKPALVIPSDVKSTSTSTADAASKTLN